MSLSVETRQVGDLTVVTCSGRLVEGGESKVLDDQMNTLFPLYSRIVLDLNDVPFIDSSGLGLLVRLVSRARAANGNLVLCSTQSKLHDILKATRLIRIFEVYPTQDEAIAAFFPHGSTSDTTHKFGTDIVCIDSSADVLAYVREVLKRAGFGVMTADNVPHAMTLLHATRPKAVVIGSGLRAAAVAAVHRLSQQPTVIELPDNFSRNDAGVASEQLLERVRVVFGA